MNILILGNGFDLAHGLPTKYTDFLFFCNAMKQLSKKMIIMDDIIMYGKELHNILYGGGGFNKLFLKLDFYDNIYSKSNNFSKRDLKVNEEIVDNFLFHFLYSKRKNDKLIKECLNLIIDNFWIEYFLQTDLQNENWIDFESEIANVIKSIDRRFHGLKSATSLYDIVIGWQTGFIASFFNITSDSNITYKIIRDRLELDLNKLIRAFEIYITKYVETINVKMISPDIEEIAAVSKEYQGTTSALLSKVVSFNYTNTYERIYLPKNHMKYSNCIDYIHGKADVRNTVSTNSMVLGIDEYLPEDRRNSETEFIAFKKYYQRINKGTGSKYKEWVDKIQDSYFEYIQSQIKEDTGRFYNFEANQTFLDHLAKGAIKDRKCKKHNLYIFGHSLDVTDKDILRDFILNDNVYTTIFYLNKDVMGQQIANLVKVIGQDELIKRTGGNKKTIVFQQQQDMVIMN